MTRVAREIRLLEQALKTTNAKTTVVVWFPCAPGGVTISAMITDYIAEALRRARYEFVDGLFCATVPGLRGVIATASTVEACRTQLAEVIEAWILIRVSRGLNVPALGRTTVRVRQAS